ncbi:tetratricopeptide repeat protein [Eubacteriaceae bacterium ES2]|nr:tetratricopeptide repeat protein [Eubacteriaceae bacterium ES2]
MNDNKLDILRFLALNGDEEALLKLADYYYFETNKQRLTPEIQQKVLNAYQLLAETGNDHAMATLGGIYYEGLLVPQNFKKAYAWFEKAAAKNNLLAINYLGYCHYYGRDIPVNHQTAYVYFAKAAQMGHHNGMYKLGDMYYNGHYVDQDPTAAFFWFNEAVAVITLDCPEYPNIAYRIGHCYLLGQGVGKDLLQALSWLHQAESGCYQLIQNGDAYAGLTLVRVQEDLDILRHTLETTNTTRQADLGYHNPLHLS